MPGARRSVRIHDHVRLRVGRLRERRPNWFDVVPELREYLGVLEQLVPDLEVTGVDTLGIAMNQVSDLVVRVAHASISVRMAEGSGRHNGSLRGVPRVDGHRDAGDVLRLI